MRVKFGDIGALAAQNGLAIVAVTSSDPLIEDAPRLAQWQAEGCAGTMQYMQRDAELLAHPQRIFPQCRSILVFTAPYEVTPHPPRAAGMGRVARYAWGCDYHTVLKGKLASFGAALLSHAGTPCTVRSFTDAVPLLERPLGARAGLGFIGKNTLLIRPGVGSYFFIGEVLTDLEIDGAPAAAVRGRCGSCRKCGSSCPTGALDTAYRVDARKCISYLTIEKRGALAAAERPLLGEWIFGCDICQDVCPFNHGALKSETQSGWPEFSKNSGVGPLLDLSSVLGIRTNAAFEARFKGTPLLRARRAGLLRNAAVVAANTSAANAARALAVAATDDASPLVRRHCAWALRVLHPALDGAERGFFAAAFFFFFFFSMDRLRLDPAPEVVLELQSGDA